MNTEFDCTTLVRKALPLPQVHIDTGPRTRADLRDKLDYAEHISVTSIHWKTATEVAALLTWALDGYVPAFTPSGELI